MLACKTKGNPFEKGAPLDSIIPKRGPAGTHTQQVYGSQNPDETKITVRVPLPFGDYSSSELTEYRGDNIPLAIYLSSNTQGTAISEMLYLCWFNKANALKPEVKINAIKSGGVWQQLKEVYGLKESELNNDQETCCIICYTNPRNTIINPCNHMCLCDECANDMIQKSHQCPICRGPLKKITTLTQMTK